MTDKILDFQKYKTEKESSVNLVEYFNLKIEYEPEFCIQGQGDFVGFLFHNPNLDFDLDGKHSIMYDDVTNEIVITNDETEQYIYLDYQNVKFSGPMFVDENLTKTEKEFLHIEDNEE